MWQRFYSPLRQRGARGDFMEKRVSDIAKILSGRRGQWKDKRLKETE